MRDRYTALGDREETADLKRGGHDSTIVKSLMRYLGKQKTPPASRNIQLRRLWLKARHEHDNHAA